MTALLSGQPLSLPFSQNKALPAAYNQTGQALPKGVLNFADSLSSGAGLEKAAEDFEAQFLTSLFAESFESATPEAPFNGGAGESQFNSFLYEEYGKAMAARGGVGIADAITATYARASYNQSLNQERSLK